MALDIRQPLLLKVSFSRHRLVGWYEIVSGGVHRSESGCFREPWFCWVGICGFVEVSGANHRISKATTSAEPPLSIYNSTDANFQRIFYHTNNADNLAHTPSTGQWTHTRLQRERHMMDRTNSESEYEDAIEKMPAAAASSATVQNSLHPRSSRVHTRLTFT